MQRFKMKYIGFIVVMLIFSCNSNHKKELTYRDSDVGIISHQFDWYANALNNRLGIELKLKQKIDENIPLVVHCFVPLCDNDHQGVVPTTASLGDGFSLTSNLYWATSNGMKRFFKEHPKWKQLKVTNHQQTDTILERVAFERRFENDAKVILICSKNSGVLAITGLLISCLMIPKKTDTLAYFFVFNKRLKLRSIEFNRS